MTIQEHEPADVPTLESVAIAINTPTKVIAMESTATRAIALAPVTATAPNNIAKASGTATAIRATPTQASSTPTISVSKPQPTLPPSRTPDSSRGGCPTMTPPALKTSGILKSVILAQGAQNGTNEPVNPTTEFKANSVVYIILGVQNAPDSTSVKTVWYAVDVGKVAACNTLIGEAELTSVSGSSNLNFQQGPIAPVGTYRVHVLVNGTLERIVNFSVR